MSKEHKSCSCGSKEFITQPNQYDLYKLVDNKIKFQKSLSTDDKLILYCRECGKIYKEDIELEIIGNDDKF